MRRGSYFCDLLKTQLWTAFGYFNCFKYAIKTHISRGELILQIITFSVLCPLSRSWSRVLNIMSSFLFRRNRVYEGGFGFSDIFSKDRWSCMWLRVKMSIVKIEIFNMAFSESESIGSDSKTIDSDTISPMSSFKWEDLGKFCQFWQMESSLSFL